MQLLNVTGPSPVIIDNCAAQDKYVNHVVRIIGWREHEDYGTLWVMVNSWGPNSVRRRRNTGIYCDNIIASSSWLFILQRFAFLRPLK